MAATKTATMQIQFFMRDNLALYFPDESSLFGGAGLLASRCRLFAKSGSRGRSPHRFPFSLARAFLFCHANLTCDVAIRSKKAVAHDPAPAGRVAAHVFADGNGAGQLLHHAST